MSKFIELHEKGVPRLINLDQVAKIYGAGGVAIFTFSAQGISSITPDESYAEVRVLIAKSQGGIPITKYEAK